METYQYTEKELCDEYDRFLRQEGLPSQCAADLLSDEEKHGLTNRQIIWLKDFVRRWEEAEASWFGHQ